LRAVNQNLRARLARLQGGPNRPAVIAPTELTDLRAELIRATDYLSAVPAGSTPVPLMENEISEYRNHLVELEKILPWIQGRLLVEKARLQSLQSHMTAAKAWALASQQTL